MQAFFAKYWPYLALGIVIWFFGEYVGYGCHKCPVISGSSRDTVVRTVQIHDTLRAKVQDTAIHVVPVVTYHKVIEPVIKPTVPADTPKPAVIVACTTYCYDAIKRQADSAVIGIHVCSAILPQTKPPDWSLEISYQRPPIVERTITVKDTVSAPVKHWNISLGTGAGYGRAGNFSGFTVSAGLYIGYSIKQF